MESCAQAVSNLAIQFGDSDDDSGTAMSRPFGVAVMFAGESRYGYVHSVFYLFIRSLHSQLWVGSRSQPFHLMHA